MRHSTRDQQMRQRIAQEAARLIATEGVRDYGAAKRKAAERLGAPDTRNMPRNTEIEAELVSYQSLFQRDEQPRHLQALRRAAVQAMSFFARFRPRLTGSVLSGTADKHSDVNLHLFAATPEEVFIYLMENQLPFEEGQRRFRFGRDEQHTVPVVRFMAGEVPIEAAIFPEEGIRQPPRSPIDSRPMERAGLARVEALLEEAEPVES
ncbi:MAG: hypothetical protein CMN57_02145 [Gammaproteobacteria bacterium]|nr:hypothetical protein [Gammaproteobacteria bacterium]